MRGRVRFKLATKTNPGQVQSAVDRASAVIQQARRHPERNLWLMRLLARKPAKVAAVALANKMARIVWVLMTRGGTYRAPALAAAA